MNQDELSRFRHGAPKEVPAGFMIISIMAQCAENASPVLDRCKEVLSLVLQPDAEEWPSTDEWRSRLPEWFVERSAEEISQAEAERRVRASVAERIRLSQQWSVSAFVYWFQPSERYWYWWDATVENENVLIVSILVESEPYPSGALNWLLRASGAVSVQEL